MPSEMVIDFHTHVFPPWLRERREEFLRRDATFRALYTNDRAKLATCEELVEAMDGAGVDRAVLLGIGWTDQELARSANDYLLEAAQRFPDRLVPFCSVDPSWGGAAVQEVERCAAGGARGIGELHPDTQGFDVTSSRVMGPLMETAQRLGLLVLTHSSEPVGHQYAGKGQTSPDRLLSFIHSFPHNTIVCAHWGGGLPFYALMPEVAQALKNVYFDTAASPLLYDARVFRLGVEMAGQGKVLFATDYPLLGHGRVMRQVEAHLSGGPLEDVLWRNAARLLGISPNGV